MRKKRNHSFKHIEVRKMMFVCRVSVRELEKKPFFVNDKKDGDLNVRVQQLVVKSLSTTGDNNCVCEDDEETSDDEETDPVCQTGGAGRDEWKGTGETNCISHRVDKGQRRQILVV